MAKIRVALLGCGTFARDAYIGMLKWAPEAVALSGEEGMCELLGRDDIRAVLLVLPVQVMLEVARRALVAGKHVLQEKPVGTTVAEARLQLSEHRSAGGGAVWCLAENYRFEDVFLEACRQVHSLGEVVKIDFIADMPMNSQNKYFGSEWRRDTETCPGGFLMDSSVHFIAALRLVASAAGAGEPVAASALLRSCTDSLPPPDSLAGMLQFANGCMATVSFSFSCSQVRFSLSVVGTHGSLEVMRGGWSGSRGMYQLKVQREGEAQPTSIDCPFSGIDAEFRAFLRRVHAAEAGQQIPPDDEELLRTDPLQGLRDLAVIEALLKSGASGGQQTPVEQVDV